MPAATSGSPIATSTDATTPPMPDANATKPAFGLTAKIFVASTLLVVAVLGVTFRPNSPPAQRPPAAPIPPALGSPPRAGPADLSPPPRPPGRAGTAAHPGPPY